MELIQLFKNKRYLNFWLSNLASNSAIWMFNMAGAIVVSQMSNSPLTNSMVQTAAVLPLFIFGIFAGIVGDRYNKYKILFIAQLTLAVLSLFLGVASLNHWFTPGLLITVTFLCATATSFRMPSAQAAITETVQVDKIKEAAILNNLGFNLCRTFGPCIAGFLMVIIPMAGVFFIISFMLSSVAVNFFIQSKYSTQTVDSAISFRSCLSQISRSRLFLVCSFDAFFLFFNGSVILALMPYFSRYKLGLDAAGQGLIMMVIGVGALTTIFVLPWLLKRFNHYSVIRLCYLAYASSISLILISNANYLPIIALALFIFGLGWSASVAALNGVIQSAFSKTIRARVISFYLLIMYFSMSLGSLWAGYLSDHWGMTTAMLISVLNIVLGYSLKSILIKNHLLCDGSLKIN